MLIGDHALPCLAFHIHGCFWLAMEENKTDTVKLHLVGWNTY